MYAGLESIPDEASLILSCAVEPVSPVANRPKADAAPQVWRQFSHFSRTGSLQYRLHEPSLRLAIGGPILGESQCGSFLQGFVSPGVIRMGPEVVPK